MRGANIRTMEDVRVAFRSVWALLHEGEPLVRLNQLTHPFVRSATRSLTADTATGIKTTTGTVDTSKGTAPVKGQVLTATSPTAATWQVPAPNYARIFLLMGA